MTAKLANLKGLTRQQSVLVRARINAAKSHSRVTGRKVNVTAEEAAAILVEQEFRDALTGQKMEFKSGTTQKRNKNVISIDRIDNSKGYTAKNIQFVTWNTNQRKQTSTVKQFVRRLEAQKSPLARVIAKKIGA